MSGVDERYRRSTFCTAGSCVEVASIDGQVHVRDTRPRLGAAPRACVQLE